MTGIMILLNVFSVFIFVISIGFLLYCKRWGKFEFARMESKKKELKEILDSADDMIEELNNFSDYMINNIQQKSLEVGEMVNTLEEKIEQDRDFMQQIKEDSNKVEGYEGSATYSSNYNTVIPIQTKRAAYSNKAAAMSNLTGYDKLNDEPQDLGSKSMQIITLSEKGFSEAEIARKLNVGRGEIQLVLGVKRGIMRA